MPSFDRFPSRQSNNGSDSRPSTVPFPAFPSFPRAHASTLSDEFTFHPTGSPTAAVSFVSPVRYPPTHTSYLSPLSSPVFSKPFDMLHGIQRCQRSWPRLVFSRRHSALPLAADAAAIGEPFSCTQLVKPSISSKRNHFGSRCLRCPALVHPVPVTWCLPVWRTALTVELFKVLFNFPSRYCLVRHRTRVNHNILRCRTLHACVANSSWR